MRSSRLVVFAYSLIGHDCLKKLLDLGQTIAAVITHSDNPDETLWFPSVKDLAYSHSIPVFTPDSPNSQNTIDLINQLNPDLIFSFYYRRLICQEILDIPSLGSFNMHGSLLPKYRGRCPANWVLIHGETESGATLHKMVSSADAGDIVCQKAFSISPTDNALDVTYKTRDAAVQIIEEALLDLLSGTAKTTPQDLSLKSYFGGRSEKDSVIDWAQPAQKIHNLIRSQTPYPYFSGGLTSYKGRTLRILKSDLPQAFFCLEPYTPGQVIESNENFYTSNLLI